jgi:hypothetical protein
MQGIGVLLGLPLLALLGSTRIPASTSSWRLSRVDQSEANMAESWAAVYLCLGRSPRKQGINSETAMPFSARRDVAMGN